MYVFSWSVETFILPGDFPTRQFSAKIHRTYCHPEANFVTFVTKTRRESTQRQNITEIIVDVKRTLCHKACYNFFVAFIYLFETRTEYRVRIYVPNLVFFANINIRIRSDIAHIHQLSVPFAQIMLFPVIFLNENITLWHFYSILTHIHCMYKLDGEIHRTNLKNGFQRNM